MPTDASTARNGAGEDGIAVLVSLIALSVFSLLSFYVVMNSVTELRISDNYESEVQASFAARAGLNHAREILRGLTYNALLQGPDGTYDSSGTYMATARTMAFRNPLAWATARSLNVDNPATALAGLPDDGVMSTGKYGTTDGTQIIPFAGIAQTAINPYGSGTITTARYFVKVSDNSGESTETTADAADNPFVDADGIIVVRSMGVAHTINETAGGTVRRNSAAVVESRFRQSQTFNLSCPLVIEGDNINVTFNGSPWGIAGGASAPGVGTIDTNTGNGIRPDQLIVDAADGKGTITGGGLPDPSVSDITAATAADPDKAKLMDPNYLWDLVNNTIPRYADQVYQGDQSWDGNSAPYLGAFDHTKPVNDPSQDPKVTVVNGNLSMAGTVSGGGLLVVTGDFNTNGRLTWDGLILVLGNGTMDAGGLNQGVWGGIFIASLVGPVGNKSFGTPTFSMSGNSHIYYDSGALAMSVSLLPPLQLSFREVTSNMDQ